MLLISSIIDLLTNGQPNRNEKSEKPLIFVHFLNNFIPCFLRLITKDIDLIKIFRFYAELRAFERTSIGSAIEIISILK